MHILPSSERFDALSSNFCSFLLLFLCFLLFVSIFFAVMDFPPIPDDLGDDFGGASAASFFIEDFNLGDVSFTQTVVGTSSAVGPSRAAGTSSGSSSRPRLSRGDPIPVVHSLETHAWITHRRPVSFLCCSMLSASLALAR